MEAKFDSLHLIDVAPKAGCSLLPDVAEKYFTHVERGWGGEDPPLPSTIKSYRKIFILHFNPHFEETGGTIESISTGDVENIRELAVDKSLSNRSVRHLVRLIKAILKYAEERRIIDRAPGSDDRVRFGRKERPAQRARHTEGVFSPSQVRTLLAVADVLSTNHHPQTRRAWALYRGLIYFLAHTGIRISEARGFPRENFDSGAGVVKIRQRACEGGTIGFPKSQDGIRDIPMHPDLIEPMQTALRQHSRDLIFSTASDRPMNNENLFNRARSQLLRKANDLALSQPQHYVTVPALGFHALRHSYASRLISAGANLKQLQTWMGHYYPAFTLRVYGHLFLDDGSAQKVLQRINL